MRENAIAFTFENALLELEKAANILLETAEDRKRNPRSGDALTWADVQAVQTATYALYMTRLFVDNSEPTDSLCVEWKGDNHD